jgi:hypothetical protein
MLLVLFWAVVAACQRQHQRIVALELLHSPLIFFLQGTTKIPGQRSGGFSVPVVVFWTSQETVLNITFIVVRNYGLRAKPLISQGLPLTCETFANRFAKVLTNPPAYTA